MALSDWITALNASSDNYVSTNKQIECLMYLWWYEDRKKNGWSFNEKQEEKYLMYSQQVKDRIANWGLE